jgi:hypothetical protein
MQQIPYFLLNFSTLPQNRALNPVIISNKVKELEDDHQISALYPNFGLLLGWIFMQNSFYSKNMHKRFL